MGVLDDAIREHLDLKRRHGVAEEELRRQEEEALGPARREVAPADSEDGNGAGEQAPAQVEAAEVGQPEQPELLGEVPAEAEPELHEEPAPVAPHDEPLPAEDEPLAAEATVEAGRRAGLRGRARLRGRPPRTGRHAASRASRPWSTDEDDPLEDEEEPAAADEAVEEDPDLLEDTPDFLQETPEHDRLWFEQKPPRDFDFE